MSRQLNRDRPNGPMRCAVYTRKSSEEGLEQEFNSLDAQREAGEAYIASQQGEGWSCLPDRYDDGGFSGGNLERPALARLLADIEGGKIHCVVVYKVDRLSRSLLDFARIMEVFDRQKVAFVSVTQQFNTAASMGRLVLNVLLSFAQFEREIIGERIRDKIAAQRRKGKWAGGVPILGYDVDRSGRGARLVVNIDEACRVRQIFELYLELGSLLPVVDELARRRWFAKSWTTKSGMRKGGRPFDRGSLHALLTNPLYVGQVKHKADAYPGEHEAVVSLDVYERVQAQLRRNARTGGAEARNRHGALLRGLLRCKSCGHAMTHNFTGRKGKHYRYYTCAQAIKRGRRACRSRSLPAAVIERAVVDQIRRFADDVTLRQAVLVQANADLVRELGELDQRRRRSALELARHHAALKQLASRGNGDESASARIADLQEHIQRGEADLAALRDQFTVWERQRLREADVEAAFASFDAIWEALSPREQSQLLSLLVAVVEWDTEETAIEVAFHTSAIQELARRAGEEAA